MEDNVNDINAIGFTNIKDRQEAYNLTLRDRIIFAIQYDDVFDFYYKNEIEMIPPVDMTGVIKDGLLSYCLPQEYPEKLEIKFKDVTALINTLSAIQERTFKKPTAIGNRILFGNAVMQGTYFKLKKRLEVGSDYLSVDNMLKILGIVDPVFIKTKIRK